MLRALVLTAALAAAGPAPAQDRAQTLADIRAELALLAGQIDGLRAELTRSGAGGGVAAGGSVLARVDAIEAALTQLTAKTEELEFRINRIVADGTNRLGDLEFRIVELEGGDVAALGRTPPLGGVPAPAPTPAPAPAAEATPQLAAQEQADFDRAREVLGQGDFRAAADLFAAFAQTYTGGPLTGEAQFLRGEALTGLNETAAAARAYLDSFSGDPDGPRAAEALWKLGESLARLKQTPEACVTLAEVGLRFPGSPAAAQADQARARLACP